MQNEVLNHQLYKAIETWLYHHSGTFNALTLVQHFGMGYNMAQLFLDYFENQQFISKNQFGLYKTEEKQNAQLNAD